MTQEAPGKHFRQGLDFLEFTEMFPTEDSAETWFESQLWSRGRRCPHCGSDQTFECTNQSLPYRCQSCWGRFSVRTGSLMHGSPLPYRKWLWAVYLHMTSLKGVSSMKLHRDIGVTQKTAWFMLQRIREAFRPHHDSRPPMQGPVEVDETYMGGKRKNMTKSKREAMTGRGGVGKAVVVGAKDREANQVVAKTVESTDKETLQGFVAETVAPGSDLYTDDHRAYQGIEGYHHKTVNHSSQQYVDGQIHTNGIESFWAMFKRAHKGVYHKFSRKHLDRYVTDFSGRHNVRRRDTLNQMRILVRGMAGRTLPYKALIADNGLWSGANGGVRA